MQAASTSYATDEPGRDFFEKIEGMSDDNIWLRVYGDETSHKKKSVMLKKYVSEGMGITRAVIDKFNRPNSPVVNKIYRTREFLHYLLHNLCNVDKALFPAQWNFSQLENYCTYISAYKYKIKYEMNQYEVLTESFVVTNGHQEGRISMLAEHFSAHRCAVANARFETAHKFFREIISVCLLKLFGIETIWQMGNPEKHQKDLEMLKTKAALRVYEQKKVDMSLLKRVISQSSEEPARKRARLDSQNAQSSFEEPDELTNSTDSTEVQVGEPLVRDENQQYPEEHPEEQMEQARSSDNLEQVENVQNAEEGSSEQAGKINMKDVTEFVAKKLRGTVSQDSEEPIDARELYQDEQMDQEEPENAQNENQEEQEEDLDEYEEEEPVNAQNQDDEEQKSIGNEQEEDLNEYEEEEVRIPGIMCGDLEHIPEQKSHQFQTKEPKPIFNHRDSEKEHIPETDRFREPKSIRNEHFRRIEQEKEHFENSSNLMVDPAAKSLTECTPSPSSAENDPEAPPTNFQPRNPRISKTRRPRARVEMEPTEEEREIDKIVASSKLSPFSFKNRKRWWHNLKTAARVEEIMFGEVAEHWRERADLKSTMKSIVRKVYGNRNCLTKEIVREDADRMFGALPPGTELPWKEVKNFVEMRMEDVFFVNVGDDDKKLELLLPKRWRTFNESVVRDPSSYEKDQKILSWLISHNVPIKDAFIVQDRLQQLCLNIMSDIIRTYFSVKQSDNGAKLHFFFDRQYDFPRDSR